ncbi:MAG: hypothetical protein U5J83_17700, partial [Bryobacterales bacterium]|nr:hypothetical protein [Bryobacterales bacterium]
GGVEPVSPLATPGDPLRLRFEVPEGRTFPRYRADWLGPKDAVRRSFSQPPSSPAEDGVFDVFINPGTFPSGTHEFVLYGLEAGRDPVLLNYYSLTLAPLATAPARTKPGPPSRR